MHCKKLIIFCGKKIENGVGQTRVLGWSKTPVSSQTDKLMAGTKFSDYLGLDQLKKQTH